MLVGTALAVFLLVRPPGESERRVARGRRPLDADADGFRRTRPIKPATMRSAETPGTVAPTRHAARRDRTPDRRDRRARSTSTRSCDGDTLFDIAEANLPPGDDLDAFAQRHRQPERPGLRHSDADHRARCCSQVPHAKAADAPRLSVEDPEAAARASLFRGAC